MDKTEIITDVVKVGAGAASLTPGLAEVQGAVQIFLALEPLAAKGLLALINLIKSHKHPVTAVTVAAVAVATQPHSEFIDENQIYGG